MKYMIIATIRSGYWWEDHWFSGEERIIVNRFPTVRMRIWASAKVDIVAIMEKNEWRLLQHSPEDETARREAIAVARKARMWIKEIAEITGVALCATYDDCTGVIVSTPQLVSSYVPGEPESDRRVEKLVSIPLGVSNVKDIPKDKTVRMRLLKQLYSLTLDAKTTALSSDINIMRGEPTETEVVPTFIRRQELGGV